MKRQLQSAQNGIRTTLASGCAHVRVRVHVRVCVHPCVGTCLVQLSCSATVIYNSCLLVRIHLCVPGGQLRVTWCADCQSCGGKGWAVRSVAPIGVASGSRSGWMCTVWGVGWAPVSGALEPVPQPGFLSRCQERAQALEAELQTVSRSKELLEKELQEVIALTSQELDELREKVAELEDEVGARAACGQPGARGPESQRRPCARHSPRVTVPGV